MAQLQNYWNELRMECDRCLVMVFYENSTGTKQDFSNVFLNGLSKLDGAICVVSVSEAPPQEARLDFRLQSFSPIQPNLIADIVGWMKKIMED